MCYHYPDCWKSRYALHELQRLPLQQTTPYQFLCITISNITNAIESLKDVVKRFWTYANTLVNNPNQVFIIFFLQFYRHLLARRRELDCIIQNISKDLSYT